MPGVCCAGGNCDTFSRRMCKICGEAASACYQPAQASTSHLSTSAHTSQPLLYSLIPPQTHTSHTLSPSFIHRPQEERVELKEFLYLPKPNHLVYIKPTVAVVADVASRASVGLKMTIGNNQLERYVVEYYSKSL